MSAKFVENHSEYHIVLLYICELILVTDHMHVISVEKDLKHTRCIIIIY